MSRKLINVVMSNNQFVALDFSPIMSKFSQLLDPESSESTIELTEDEILQVYGAQSLSEINNSLHFIISTLQGEVEPGLFLTAGFTSKVSMYYFRQDETFNYRVYNVISFEIDEIQYVLEVKILKDEVEETEDLRNSFSISK